MTAPNHIVGGIVFTGSFCSLFNINIFSNPYFIVITFLGCFIPDIDHTKSIIGKFFFPIAKYISRNYGHRTITHSLIFILLLTFLSSIIDKIYFIDFTITTIVFFSILSHFIFDMITIQGIPLLYPFYKNPCVIPGNQKLRIRTGDRKAEGTFFFIFAILSFTLFGLFENGFWTTFNNSFNDISHVYSNFKKSDEQLIISYDYNCFQENKKGKGYLISAKENEIYFFDKEIIKLSKNENGIIINELQTESTKDKMEIATINFNSISIDSINEILKNKIILSGSIFTNEESYLYNSDLIEKSKHFNLNNAFNVYFKQDVKEEKEKDNLKYLIGLEDKLEEKYISLKIELEQIENYNSEINSIKREIEMNKIIVNSENDLYKINESKNEIIRLEKELNKLKPKSKSRIKLIRNSINKIQEKIRLEKNKKEIQEDKLYFTGTINQLIISNE